MALSTQYDPLFQKYAGGSIPVAYLRALSYRESGQNPSANAGKAAAQGLLQITTTAMNGYNQKHGTSYATSAALDPNVGIPVAVDLLQAIIRSYAGHPSDNLHVDWGNPEFVKLLTAGWNAGYSDGGGVGKVATYLERAGRPVTHDSVVGNAGAAGAVSYLGDVNRAAWHRSVSDLYFAQPDAGQTGGGSIMTLALLGIAAWGAYTLLS